VEAERCGDVTVLLQQVTAGQTDAADKLIPLVLGDLHRLARSYLHPRGPDILYSPRL
jgi:hypothetical protein